MELAAQQTLSHEEEAVNAYIKFLKQKGLNQDFLDKRLIFLKKLTSGLMDKPLNRNEYAMALHAVLKKKHDSEWHDHIKIAREFYPFWMKDIRAIVLLNENYGIDLQAIHWKPLPASLQSLSVSLAKERFDERESLLLERYMQGLQKQGVEKRYIFTRIKLAKIILLRLRDAPKGNNLVYRMAVDVTLPLFRLKKSRQFFLIVVREFFYIWMLSPNASQPAKAS